MPEIAGIPVEVQRKRIKNVHLYVKPPDGRVVLTAPFRVSDEEIEEFVLSKRKWIQKHQAKLLEEARKKPVKYTTGEPLPLWGVQYTIQLKPSNINLMVLSGDQALLKVRKSSTVEQREQFVREWYREQLKAKVEQLLPKWEAITGLECASWQSKYMTTRWGTCNVRAKRIWLNVRLAEKPIECLEYVIVHELVHLKERGHGAGFKALMDKFMPNWREVRAKLNH